MTRRILDGSLLIMTLLGGLLAWRETATERLLHDRYDRYRAVVGDLPGGDPTKIRIAAIPTDDPLDFRWRVQLPPNCETRISSDSGSMSSGRSSQAVDFVAQLRLRIDPEDGRLQKYLRWWHGSSRLKVGDRALAEAIRGRERFLTVKQAGIEDPLEVDPGSPIELLEVSLSSEMLDELRRAGYSNHPLHKTPSLVRLRVDGPATPEPGR